MNSHQPIPYFNPHQHQPLQIQHQPQHQQQGYHPPSDFLLVRFAPPNQNVSLPSPQQDILVSATDQSRYRSSSISQQYEGVKKTRVSITSNPSTVASHTDIYQRETLIPPQETAYHDSQVNSTCSNPQYQEDYYNPQFQRRVNQQIQSYTPNQLQLNYFPQNPQYVEQQQHRPNSFSTFPQSELMSSQRQANYRQQEQHPAVVTASYYPHEYFVQQNQNSNLDPYYKYYQYHPLAMNMPANVQARPEQPQPQKQLQQQIQKPQYQPMNVIPAPPQQVDCSTAQVQQSLSQNYSRRSQSPPSPINNGIFENDEAAEEEELLNNIANPYVIQAKQKVVLNQITTGGTTHIATVETSSNSSRAPSTKSVKKIKPKKKYKQSRQKNVFKNFGNALMNCIHNNFVIRDIIEKRFAGDITAIESFHSAFLLNLLNNLKNKDDFLCGWRDAENNSDNFNAQREIFRDLSLKFFNEYAERYVQESDKLKNKDIHIKAIPIFIRGIINVEELYKFKLS